MLHGQLSFYETFPLGGASVQKQVNNMHTRTHIQRDWRQSRILCVCGVRRDSSVRGREREREAGGSATSKNIRFTAHTNSCVRVSVCVCVGVRVCICI